jgi:hypothetical protein
MFDPNMEENRLDLLEWLPDRAAADQWLRWNREQWWTAFQHAARLAHDREVVEVAEAQLQSSQLGHLAWADLTEQ